MSHSSLNTIFVLLTFVNLEHVNADRSTVSLNFGWRAALAAAEPPTCTVNYTVSLNNQRCMGLSSLSATDPTSCAAAACSAFMQGWQWLE